jgi:ribosomal protein L7/L12
MGDVLQVILPAVILAAVLWGLSTALRPRNPGISDAERYQLELAMRSQAHYAQQVQAAEAARARVDAATRPSQNEQQQTQQRENARDRAQHAHASGGSGYLGPVLPGGQLNPHFELELQALARSGHKVQAIKMLRQATSSDLLTAKNHIDRL